MEWQYICPGCGEVVERLTSLTSATAHYFCQVCSADRDADQSEFVEVTFNIAPEIRRSRFHDPTSLSPEEYFFGYRRVTLAAAYIEPGATRTFTLVAEDVVGLALAQGLTPARTRRA